MQAIVLPMMIDYFDYFLVAKKTLFCSCKYNIILRLNHSYIVPLLAVVVGENISVILIW